MGKAAVRKGTDKPLSWLRLPEPKRYAPAIRALHEETMKRLGYVRNFLRIPFEPERLALYQGYLDRLMRSDDAQLPGLERELLALVASVENRCEICIISHSLALQKHGMARELVDSVNMAWRRAELTPRHRALAEFASRLTLHPGDAEESWLHALRKVGLTEAQILEAAQIVAIYNSNNRLNNAIGLRPDELARRKYRGG